MKSAIVLICLLSVIQLAFAQSTKKSFWQLSCPEKWWVVTHPFVANKARKITADVICVSEEMKKDSLLDGDAAGGQVDAFRHAYWMAALSQKICRRKAIALGKAHEKGDYRKFKKRKVDDELNIPDSISSVMDLYNNDIGASIGCQNNDLDTGSLRKLIRSNIIQGKMKIISKNSEGKILNCDGNVLDINLYLYVWNIPKCLVASDFQRRK